MRKLRQCLIPLTWLGSWRAWGSAHPHGHWVPCPQCSTTCGLGAVWRLVRCSSGREEDCAPAGRPQPARRCHLRPCAAWHTGNWSKVREGGGWQPQGTSGALGPRPVFGISRSHHQSAGRGPCAQLCTLISSLRMPRLCGGQPAAGPFSYCLYPFLCTSCNPQDFIFSSVPLFLHLSCPGAAPGHTTLCPRLVSHGLSLGLLRDLPWQWGWCGRGVRCSPPPPPGSVCAHTGPSASSVRAAAAGAPPHGTCSVWTHGTSSPCGPSTASRGPPSRPPAGPAGPNPASAGTPLPGGR